MRSRAVFVILWTPHLENREEYEENGIPLRNQPLAYWLDYVRTLAGPGSAVIVVQSQCDQVSERRHLPLDPEGFGFIESCYYSAKSEEEIGRDTLEPHLKGAIRYLREQGGALRIGAGRFRLRENLYAWQGEDQSREVKAREHRTLTLQEFRDLCDRTEGIVSWEHALDYLHQTGVVFYEPGLFSGLIVLDQTWALEAIYSVFHRGRTAPWLRDSGRFTREDLASLAWGTYPPEEQKLFLGLMESCGVCFQVGKAPEGETVYIAPDLLPSFRAIRLPAWREAPDLPTLRLEYRFFHQAVIRGLLREIGRQAGDRAEYWKYGFWFQDGKREAQVLLQVEDTSTEQEPGAGALLVRAQGRDPLGLLREIRKSILRQRIGERPEEWLTLEGRTVERSALAGVVEGKVCAVGGESVPAALFSAFFSDRKEALEEARREKDSQTLDIQPRPLRPEDKRPEVYISYAWGDDSPEGRIRSQAVDALYKALGEDGFQPIRDREAMKNGDRISSFIRQLTRADLVVAVVSEKYFRSPYCMFEIYRLWQRSQEDPEVMASCVVPVVLPDLAIKTIPERLVFTEHWLEQVKQLRGKSVELILSLGVDSFQKAKLIQKFAEDVEGILAFVEDVLTPRNLEVHLDNGFEAVRDALRRRVAERKT